LADDEHERDVMMPYPPLGLLYLSSFLKAAGAAVEVYDTTFGSVDGFRDRLAEAGPAVVGLATNLMTRAAVLRMIAIAREAGTWVVLGGPEAEPNAADYLRAGADVVVVGEGEATLEELCRHLPVHGRQRLEAVAGIAYLDDRGRPRTTPPRPQIRPLSSLPWPDRDAVDMDRYLSAWRDRHGFASVSLITSRGCPFTCAWCSHGVFGRSHRRREVAEVADEVEHILDRWEPERLWYADDVFTHNRPWTVAYAAELRRRGVRVPFECISRADRIDDRVADALADMGCARLWIGSESGSQRVLDAMGRLATVEDIRAKTALLQDRGIEVGMFLMLGYDGEEERDLAATVDHLKRSAPDAFLTTVAYPIRGTEYFDRVRGRIRADRPWAERTDRDLRIAGRRSRRYYDHAGRWMVNEVNLALAWRRGSRNVPRLARMLLAAGRGRLGMWLSRLEREAGTGREASP
ncbi:MAG TPA: radical SAM protein, partial [Candidatus Sulfomarinibacteraceae bacterium]|nr:radical SAM protein [Candidatus Sulfomarinibacteraceae bacterium]